MISTFLTLLVLALTTGATKTLWRRRQQRKPLALPDRLNAFNTSLLRALKDDAHLQHRQDNQQGLEGLIGERTVLLSYQMIKPNNNTSNDLVSHASLPFALATLTLQHPNPAEHTFQWRYPSTKRIGQTGKQEPRALFEPQFDKLYQCRGAIDDVLCAMTHVQRQHMLRAVEHLEGATFSQGRLRLTFQLYVNSDAEAMAEHIRQWFALHDKWTRSGHLPRRLIDALKQEPHDDIAQRLLKALLRHHSHSAACEDAIEWSLAHQSRAKLHVIIAKIWPKALKAYPTLQALLLGHLDNPSIDIETRKQCMGILFRDAKQDPAVIALFAKLGLEAKNPELRTSAIAYTLRMPEHDQVDRATLILSARHLLKQRHLSHDAIQQLKTQLKYQRAHTTHQTHITLAQTHIDHTVRYASLRALEAKYLHKVEVITCLLHCAIYDTHHPTRSFCVEVLKQHKNTWYEDLEHITRTTHRPLICAMAAIVTQAPYDFSDLEDSAREIDAKLHILQHLQDAPHPDLSPIDLFDLWMHQEAQQHCIDFCMQPEHILIYQNVLRQSAMTSETTAYAMLEQIDLLKNRYHNDSRLIAQRLTITVLQLQNNIALKQRALQTLTPLATQTSVAPLNSMMAVLEHTYPFAHKRPHQVAIFMNDAQNLIEQLNHRNTNMNGALSLSHTDDTNGALSITHVNGALAMIKHPDHKS